MAARRASRWRWMLAAALAVAGTPVVAQPTTAPGSGTAGTQPELTAFLEQYCVRCHGAQRQRGDIAVHNLGQPPRSGAEIDTWKKVLGQIDSGHMPPDDASQPSPQQRRQAIAMIYGTLERVGVRREGNEVDHEALFASDRRTAAPATQGRLWRLSQPAYENFFRERFKGARSAARVRAPWEMVPDPRTGFSDFSSFHRIGEAELEHHLRNAIPVVREVLQGRSRVPELEALCKAGKDASARQVEEVVNAIFRQVLQRAPAQPELQRYVGFVQKNLQAGGAESAAEQLLLAVLLHPEVVYRVETSVKQVDQEVLPSHHLARAIAYALTDQGPDAALRQAAADGKLRTRQEIGEQVLRILNDPQKSKQRLLRFFREYFGYTTAPDVFKDAPTLQAADVVPDAKFTAKEGRWAEASHCFVCDTDWLILDILQGDRDVLRELLTTRKTYALTKPGRDPCDIDAAGERLSKAKTSYREGYNKGFFFGKGVPLALRIYELDEIAIRRDAWAPDRPYEMPAGRRLGILTHPSWLVAHSDNFDNNPIHRGKWIREKLLGYKLPEIPITVDAKLPNEPHNTLRERMRVTREAYCWKCHQRMDPLGLPFEMYDHFGRYRETELNRPVDTTGFLDGSGDPRLDGPVRDAHDLIRRLADSPRVEQVFVRHVFRYFVGRNETLEDGPALREAHRAYVQSQGSMKALIAAILTSEAFLYRVARDADRQDPPSQRSEP